MKLYTIVVHNLQMCMKEYRCCLKFRRGGNSTYTFTKRGAVYFLSATPPKWALTRYMDGRTGRFLYTPQTLFAGGIMNRKMIGEAIYIRVSDRK
jgi:hypothetical protein